MLSSDGFSLPPVPQSAAEEQAQLRAHFAEVERILIANTPRSLAVTVWRFERAHGTPLSVRGRANLVRALYLQRLLQIARLKAYRDQGLFPRNDEPGPERGRPVFVDRHGTACAVGYLMLSSGRFEQVESISQANNYVVAADVQAGPLADWTLQSGLTQEEVALVQPMYQPPSHYVGTLASFIASGGAIEYQGLRYSNFSLSQQFAGGQGVDPGAMQLIVDLSDIIPGFMTSTNLFEPSGTNFLALHGELGRTTGTDSLTWRLGFDAESTNPLFALSAAYLTSSNYHSFTYAEKDGGITQLTGPDGALLPNLVHIPPWPGGPPEGYDYFTGGYARYEMAVRAGNQSAANVGLGGAPTPDNFANFPFEYYLAGSRQIAVSPTQKIHVDTQLTLAGEAYSLDIIQEFTLVRVPEPATASIAAVGGALLGIVGYVRSAVRRRYSRRSTAT